MSISEVGQTNAGETLNEKSVERIQPERAEIVPKHGHGRLRPFQKGTTGNPGGVTAAMKNALVALREWHGERGAQRLIELAESEDHRVASVCTLAIWDRVVGKVKDKPDESINKAIDWSKLTDEQRDLVRAALVALAGAAEKAE